MWPSIWNITSTNDNNETEDMFYDFMLAGNIVQWKDNLIVEKHENL